MEQNTVRCVAVTADDTSYAAVYSKWMCGEIKHYSEKSKSGEYEWVTFPFLDHHNDFIQLLVQSYGGNGYMVSDNGFFYCDLMESGVDVESGENNDLLREIITGFNLGISEDLAIFDWADSEADLPETINRVLQAGIMISTMYTKLHGRDPLDDEEDKAEGDE